MKTGARNSDETIMLILVGASLVGFVLGAVFLAEPRTATRYTELSFTTHKVSLEPYSGDMNLNDSLNPVTGDLFGNAFIIIGPDTDEEELIIPGDGSATGLKIYQTFKMGNTYLTFADATSEESLFHEYPREVFEFTDVRLSFEIGNRRGEDRTYYYETRLGDQVKDSGGVPVKAGGNKTVISSFPVGTTDNRWTRVYVTLDTGQNISFGFRTYD